jgi:hypothetical protein
VIISHFNFWLYANDLTYIKLNLPNVINDKDNKLKENNIYNNNNNEFKAPEDIPMDDINNNNNNSDTKNKNENNI